MTYIFTSEDVVDVVRDIAKASPDFIYESPVYTTGQCRYAHGDKDNGYSPGCLMGQALNRLGVDLSEVVPYEGESVSYVLNKLGIHTTANINSWLDTVQVYQDEGSSWGYAVNNVDDDYIEFE